MESALFKLTFPTLSPLTLTIDHLAIVPEDCPPRLNDSKPLLGFSGIEPGESIENQIMIVNNRKHRDMRPINYLALCFRHGRVSFGS